MLSRCSFSITFALVAISIAISSWQALVPYLEQPTRDVSLEVDWGYLNHGLDKIHSFRDTLRWWTGPWCGEVPFWRPLSSYIFWAMRVVWAKEYLLPRQVLCILSHLCFVVLAYLFVLKVTERKWVALLTIWLFAGYRPFPLLYIPQLKPVVDALTDPKNIPDPLAGVGIMASLLLLANGKWLAALVAATVAVGFKEIGFTAWPLAFVTVLWLQRERLDVSSVRRGISTNIVPIGAWVCMLAILVLVHWESVGFGYRLGTNRTWLLRMITYLGGSFLNTLLSNNYATAATALFAFIAVRLLWKTWVPFRLLGVVGAFFVGAALDDIAVRQGLAVSLVRILSPDGALWDALACLLWLAVAWEGRHDWQTIAFGWCMAFVAALPTWVASQILPHARYTSALFMEIAVAASLVQAGVRLLSSQYIHGKFRSFNEKV